jgi:hypothetical protein
MIFSNISYHLSDPAPAEQCPLTGDRRLEELYGAVALIDPRAC